MLDSDFLPAFVPQFSLTAWAPPVISSCSLYRSCASIPNGDVFVNLQRSQRGALASIRPGQVGLRDTNNDGRADVIERFGDGGNTGIALFNGYLYADVGTSIVRYPLPSGQLRPSGPPDTVVTGLPEEYQSMTSSIANGCPAWASPTATSSSGSPPTDT